MMDKSKAECHPLEPFFPEGAKLLMLGSFPPKRERWRMDFYYPNFHNDMWRIFGIVFFGDKDHFIAGDRKGFREDFIRQFLAEKGIAVSDTARSVVRLKDNASDKFLEVVEPIALEEVLEKLPYCEAVVTTGQKATDTLMQLIEAKEPRVGSFSEFTCRGRKMRFYRMPSSSRAYPKPLAEKAEYYKKMMEELGLKDR